MGEKEEGAELAEEEDGEPQDEGGQGSPGGQQLKSAAPESRGNEPPVGRPAGHTEYLTDTHHQLFGQSTLSLSPPPTLFPAPSHQTQQCSQD